MKNYPITTPCKLTGYLMKFHKTVLFIRLALMVSCVDVGESSIPVQIDERIIILNNVLNLKYALENLLRPQNALKSIASLHLTHSS